MSIKFVTGDLFNTPGLKCICHGCNCAGAMGMMQQIKNFLNL